MAVISQTDFQRGRTRRKWMGRAFHALCLLSVGIALGMLAVLLVYLLIQGATRIDWSFLTSFASRHADQAGIKAAMLGSIYVVIVAGVVAFILGVASALYLEEYAARSKFARIAKINIANLAGVPSIVYGILGLEIFVRTFSMGQSILAGGFTLALLVLPIVIVAAGEAIRAVPQSLREGAYALGATRWQVVWNMVIPEAFAGIMTGVILAVSRAIGETAPLIAMGALTFVPFTPDSPFSRFTVLPIQIFNWTSRPQEGFQEAAAAGIIVLLVILLVMNAGAVILRNRFQKKWKDYRLQDLDAILQTRGLNVYYDTKKVVTDVNLDVARHRITAIIGPSGCGKSTLLRCFNRMNDLIPSARVEGQVLFDGRDLYKDDVDPTEIRYLIGMVFQRPNPFPKSIYDNVAFGPRINGFKGDMDELVERSIRRAALWDEVKDRLNSSALALSGGQQQRLCIARALAVEPSVILMDEPCSALDPIATLAIEDLMRELSEDYSIIIVTHNMQQAARVSNYTAFLMVEEARVGFMVEFGESRQIFTNPEDERTEAYITGRFG